MKDLYCNSMRVFQFQSCISNPNEFYYLRVLYLLTIFYRFVEYLYSLLQTNLLLYILSLFQSFKLSTNTKK